MLKSSRTLKKYLKFRSNLSAKRLNNTILSMIGMKPKDAIKLDTVPLDKKHPEETVLPEDGLHRYLYQSSEQHGDQKR